MAVRGVALLLAGLLLAGCVHAQLEPASDVASASLLEVFIDETERRTWFLFEAGRQEGSNAA